MTKVYPAIRQVTGTHFLC